MATNVVPFLLKFSKDLSEKPVSPVSTDVDKDKGTFITRVARETTDDR